MSLEKILSQSHISRNIISNIDSLVDISNLFDTSPFIYNDLANITIKKDISVSSNSLLIFQVPIEYGVQIDLNKIRMNFEDKYGTIEEIYEHLTSLKNKFEHVNTIEIEVDDFNHQVELPILDQYFTKFALFIDDLFDLCPNADTLHIESTNIFQLSIIKKLKSSKIRVIKNSFSSSSEINTNFIYDPNECIVENLKGLEEYYFCLDEIDFYSKPKHVQIFSGVVKYLGEQKKGKINIDGSISTRRFKLFEKFIKIVQRYNVDIGLSINFYSNELLLKKYKGKILNDERFVLKNVTEFDVYICNFCIFKTFLDTLPCFKYLKVIRILVGETLIQHMMDHGTIFSEEFKLKLSSNFKNIQEVYLKFFTYYPENKKEQSILNVNETANHFLSCLGEQVKLLYLEGIPNMDNKMAKIISKKCPNLEDIGLSPFDTIDINFFENMKKLKTIYFNDCYEINIPLHVEMVISDCLMYDENATICNMNAKESFNFFKSMFKRSFRNCIRNCDRGRLIYNILFDKMVSWNVYLKKLSKYTKINEL
uniref:Leucine-rich repeat containing protein n=1 Tax=Parastrongyloides trichosuri TaxID=131310 RepID=A0A0N5A001_PARTI